MSLTHTEILQIIETCKGHVKSLKIKGGSVEVEFVTPHQPTEQPPSTQNQGQKIEIPENYPPISDEKNVVKNLVESKEADEVRDEELIDELNITDPSKMEDLIALGEVVNAREEA